jgi:hypothetical protein
MEGSTYASRGGRLQVFYSSGYHVVQRETRENSSGPLGRKKERKEMMALVFATARVSFFPVTSTSRAIVVLVMAVNSITAHV